MSYNFITVIYLNFGEITFKENYYKHKMLYKNVF